MTEPRAARQPRPSDYQRPHFLAASGTDRFSYAIRCLPSGQVKGHASGALLAPRTGLLLFWVARPAPKRQSAPIKRIGGVPFAAMRTDALKRDGGVGDIGPAFCRKLLDHGRW